MSDTTFVPGTVVASSWLNDVNASVYRASTGLAGATNRTALSKFSDVVSILDFGAIMNDSSAPTRLINTNAILAALAINRTVYFPAGTLWINTVALTGFWHFRGAGCQSSFIKGDGDLFTMSTSDNGEMRLMEHLSLANDVTRGKLFSNTVLTNRVSFETVNFGKSNYHIYSTGEAVGWTVSNCRFVDAVIESRHFEGLWVYREDACYTWFSTIGLRCTNGNVSTCSIDGSTFEQMDNYAILLDASNVSFEVAGFHIYATHFEVNGKLTNNADIAVITSAATRLRNISMNGCGFFSPTATQTVRVSVTTGGGGNIDFIEMDNCALMGTIPLCTNTSAIKARNIYFQSLSMPSNVTVPIQVMQAFNNKFLGSESVIGISVGSGGIVATGSVLPAGTKMALISVQGNIYNGGANTHTGYLDARYFASGTRLVSLHDVNNGTGTNQGFVVGLSGGAIQITNKAAMTNNQSGDLVISYWG